MGTRTLLQSNVPSLPSAGMCVFKVNVRVRVSTRASGEPIRRFTIKMHRKFNIRTESVCKNVAMLKIIELSHVFGEGFNS